MTASLAEDPCNDVVWSAPLESTGRQVYYSGTDQSNHKMWNDARDFCILCSGKLYEPRNVSDNMEFLEVVRGSDLSMSPPRPTQVWIGVRTDGGGPK